LASVGLAPILEDPSVVRGKSSSALTRETIPNLVQQSIQRGGAGAIRQPPAVTKMTSGFARAVPQVVRGAPSALGQAIMGYVRGAPSPQ
jgi:hypothetical protein